MHEKTQKRTASHLHQNLARSDPGKANWIVFPDVQEAQKYKALTDFW